MATPPGKRHRREAAGRIRRVGQRLIEVFIDVEGVERGVEGRIGWPEAEALFGSRQQRLEVGHVGLVEGLGQLGQHELAPVGRFGGDDAGGVTPIELADRDRVGGARVVGRGRRRGLFVSARRTPVVAAFAAQFAVGIAAWAAGFCRSGR